MSGTFKGSPLRTLVLASLAATALYGCSGSTPTNDDPAKTGGTLIRESKITGRVELLGEANHGDVEVLLSGPAGGTARTDGSGAFAFEALLPGTYTVVASASSTLESVRISGITVAERASAALPALTFTSVGHVSGTVTLGAPTGNAGIVVSVVGGSAVAVTDDAGAYSLKNVAVGAQTVVASAAGRGSVTGNVTVTRGATVTAAALVLTAVNTAQGHLTGSVLLTGETSHGNIVVMLTGAQTAVQLTSVTGAYDFAGLGNGPYTVTAHAESTRELSRTVSATVVNGDGTAPTMTFSPVGSISGKVTRSGAATGNAGTIVFVAGKSAATFTDNAGNYTLTLVDTGSQSVSAAYSGFDVGLGAAVAVTYKGNAAAATVDLSPTVSTSNTASIVSTAARVGFAPGFGIAASLDSGAATATTDMAGTFTLSNLATGVYPLKLSMGDYEATIPQLLVVPGGRAFVADGTVYELPHVDLPKGQQLLRAVDSSPPPLALPDGSAVIASTANGLRKFDAVTGAQTPLTSVRPNRFELSKDGAYALAWTIANGLQRLDVVTIATGATAALSTNSSGFAFTTPTGKAFVVESDLRTAKVTTLPANNTATFSPGWFNTNSYYGCGCVTLAMRVSANQTTVLYPVTPLNNTCAVNLKTLNIATQTTSDIVAASDAAGASVSDDGTRVAYGRGACTVSRTLWTASSSGGSPLQLATDYGGSTVISPDGSKVAYISSAGALKVVNSNGTTTVTNVAGVARDDYAWTADSSRLVYTVLNGSFQRELRAVDPSTNSTQLLGADVATYGALGSFIPPPYFTIVGTRALAQLNSSSGNILVIADAVSGSANTFGPYVYGAFALSPDRTKVAFITDIYSQNAALKVVALSSPLATVLDTAMFTSYSPETPFSFSPDGTKLAYQTQVTVNGVTSRYLKTAPAVGGAQTFINSSPLMSFWVSNARLGSIRGDVGGSPGPLSVLNGLYLTDSP